MKLLIFITKMLEFSRGKSGVFYMLSCNLQVMLSSTGARFFSFFQLVMRFCNMRPVFSKRFSLEFSQRHFQTLMLHISFGLTWLLTLVARLHGMADFDSLHIASTPPVWIRTIFFQILFLAQKTPVSGCKVASFLLTQPQTQDVTSHARVSQVLHER